MTVIDALPGTVPEVAAALGITRSAAYQRLRRARLKGLVQQGVGGLLDTVYRLSGGFVTAQMALRGTNAHVRQVGEYIHVSYNGREVSFHKDLGFTAGDVRQAVGL